MTGTPAALKHFIDVLDEGGLNLMILKDDQPLYKSRKGGMAPLLEAINSLGSQKLAGSTVVDRIVGRAAALLISYFRARDEYARLLSRMAMDVLERHGIRCVSERVTDHIRNREDTDICPFERIVLEIEDPRKGYEKLSSELTHATH